MADHPDLLRVGRGHAAPLAEVVEDVLHRGLSTSGHRLQELLINGVDLRLEVTLSSYRQRFIGIAFDFEFASI